MYFFNFCFICKVNSDTFFAFLFFFVAHRGIGPRKMIFTILASRGRNFGCCYPHGPQTAYKTKTRTLPQSNI